jgi:DDE superfamily endonuclease
VLLAEDETDLLLFPPLRAAWALRGEPKRVLLCGRNARRTIFGALNLSTGHRLFLAREHQRAVDFQAFLRVIHWSYRGWHVALLLDEDPCHTIGQYYLKADFSTPEWEHPGEPLQVSPRFYVMRQIEAKEK